MLPADNIIGEFVYQGNYLGCLQCSYGNVRDGLFVANAYDLNVKISHKNQKQSESNSGCCHYLNTT